MIELFRIWFCITMQDVAMGQRDRHLAEFEYWTKQMEYWGKEITK